MGNVTSQAVQRAAPSARLREESQTPRAPRRWSSDVVIVSLLALLALVVRVGHVRASGGFGVAMSYDDGVFFAAINATLGGQTPYLDFSFIHPPGLLILGTVPVWAGHAFGFGDSETVAALRGMFVMLGVVNTGLTFYAGRHLSRAAGVTAALLYATWLPMIREERTITSEAIVTMCIMASLALVPVMSNRLGGAGRQSAARSPDAASVLPGTASLPGAMAGTPATSPPEGVLAKGVLANAAPANGAPANGAPANGAPANGAPANGAPRASAVADAAPAESAVANGSHRRGVEGWWRPVLAGALGGLAVVTKLWAIVPLAVILVALLIVGRRRWVVQYVASAAATAFVVVLPFAVRAGGAMGQRIVIDQMDSPTGSLGVLERVQDMLDAGFPVGSLPVLDPQDGILMALAFLIVGVTVVAVWSLLPLARVWVALLAVQGLILLVLPVYDTGYSAIVGSAGVLVAGAAFHLLWNVRLPGAVAGAVRPFLVAGCVVGTTILSWMAVTTHWGWAIHPRVHELVADARCVASDDPMTLALTNKLSSNLENGCAVEADLIGGVPGTDRPTDRRRRVEPTVPSDEFQAHALAYYEAADAVIIRRVEALSDESWEQLDERPWVRIGRTFVFLESRAS